MSTSSISPRRLVTYHHGFDECDIFRYRSSQSVIPPAFSPHISMQSTRQMLLKHHVACVYPGYIRGGHSKRFWAILTTIQSLLQIQKRFRIYSGSGRLERFWSESSLLQKRLRRSIWLQNPCFCLDKPSRAIHMQYRIENPFGAQRGGQAQSRFDASDSAQNQLKIAPESKAESLTVTAPIVHTRTCTRAPQLTCFLPHTVFHSALPSALARYPRLSIGEVRVDDSAFDSATILGRFCTESEL